MVSGEVVLVSLDLLRIGGKIVLGPLEFLAVAALPLGAISSVLKRALVRRFGLDPDDGS